MPNTAHALEAVALEDLEGHWELHDGRLQEKPRMSFGHNEAARELADQLIRQLPKEMYRIFQNRGHLRAPNGATYTPDVAIVPMSLMAKLRIDPTQFEVYDEPVPFLAEVWSPKTGTYDIDSKFPAYRLRGDAEIWRIHPFQRTLTVWRRPDGQYERTEIQENTVRLHVLPEVIIHLDFLFSEL